MIPSSQNSPPAVIGSLSRARRVRKDSHPNSTEKENQLDFLRLANGATYMPRRSTFPGAARITSAIQSALLNSTKDFIPARENPLGLKAKERALIREKNRLKTRWSRYRNPQDRIQLSRLQAKVKLMLSERKAGKWRHTIEDANDEDNNFWSLLKGINRRKDPNSPLRFDGQLIFTDLAKAEATVGFFEKQFTNNVPEDPGIVRQVKASAALFRNFPVEEEFTTVSLESVSKKISTLKWKKAPGMDAVPNRALRLLPLPAIKCPVRLLNGVLRYGVFPNIWKQAVLISIPKKIKYPAKLENPRPISLLPGLAKLSESIVKDQLQDFAEEQGLPKANQFGFRNRLAAVFGSDRGG